MSPELRLAAIEAKLNLLLNKLVSPEDLQEAELEAQYAEALRQAGANPALLRQFVQKNAAWVAQRDQKQV